MFDLLPTLLTHRAKSALLLIPVVASVFLAVSCGKEQPPPAFETGVLNLMRNCGYTPEDFISQYTNRKEKSVYVALGLDRMSVERLVTILKLKPYDETSDRYLKQDSLLAYNQWRCDRPCGSAELDSMGLQSVEMYYGESDAWLELTFTFGKDAAVARPSDPFNDQVFTLNAEQDAEVQQRRIFRPTPKQLARLRKLEPTCPSVFAVINSRWNECKCGMTGTVVWSRPGEVGTAGGRLTRWDKAEPELLKVDAANGDTTAACIWTGASGPKRPSASLRGPSGRTGRSWSGCRRSVRKIAASRMWSACWTWT